MISSKNDIDRRGALSIIRLADGFLWAFVPIWQTLQFGYGMTVSETEGIRRECYRSRKAGGLWRLIAGLSNKKFDPRLTEESLNVALHAARMLIASGGRRLFRETLIPKASAMNHTFRIAALVALLLPLASGCSSMPRWDWWRSAQTGPPPGAMAGTNTAPKYPALPSTTATPENIAASTGTPSSTASTTASVPPGTAAPVSTYPSTGTTTGVASTAMPGAYPSTSGSYSPQTTPYDANAYSTPYANTQPAAHVASNTNQYGTPSNYNTGGDNAYPGTGTPTYPSTNTGYNNPAPTGGTNPYAAPGATGGAGYQAGSPYDSPAGDRYGTPAGTNYTPPANTNGAPGTGSPSGYNSPAPPAGGNYSPPQNNYGAPSGYQGSDAGPTNGGANYAGASSAVGDRYSSANVDTAGPITRTADASGALPAGGAHYDSNVTPASGDTYLPAGTKRLEGEMPTSPNSMPEGGNYTPPAGSGSYGQPGAMG